MFQTDILWEQPSSFFAEVMDRPGLRRYSMIEVPVGAPVYQVTLQENFPGQSGSEGRYLLTSLSKVLEVADENPSLCLQIFVLLVGQGASSYAIREIIQISSFNDDEDFPNLVCTFENGDKYLDGVGTWEIQPEILQTLWNAGDIQE